MEHNDTKRNIRGSFDVLSYIWILMIILVIVFCYDDGQTAMIGDDDVNNHDMMFVVMILIVILIKVMAMVMVMVVAVVVMLMMMLIVTVLKCLKTYGFLGVARCWLSSRCWLLSSCRLLSSCWLLSTCWFLSCGRSSYSSCG